MTLAEFGPDARQAAGPLARTLQADCISVRRLAAAALGSIGPCAPVSIAALIEALAEDDDRIRAVVTVSLSRMGGRAIPRLIDALGHPEAKIRERAARSLARTGRRPETIDALEQLLDDPNPLVRETAAVLLEGD
jgi:HEAT repeat protein